MLEATGHTHKARLYLKRAHEELLRRARCIEQEELRDMFLQNIQDHRRVLERWQELMEQEREN